ncbi:MAG: hypothetical protein JSS66_09925 [Armatimonadetes bacterium]|nr:hypothetical protein [Armatimonadota bacterium]
MSRGKLGCLITFGVIALALLIASPWLVQVALTVRDAKKAGLLDEETTEKYKVGRENNLKAIQKALLQLADSDGSLPKDGKWMDAALVRLKTSDISEQEARDKLVVPGAKPGEFGYALNRAFLGKHPDQFRKDPKTILVFESTNRAWNAVGEPLSDGTKGGKGIALDGTIIQLEK